MAETPVYEYVTTTGVIVPDTSAILTDTQDEYQTTFGSDLIVTPDTPQGVLITAESLARAQVVNNNAALANQLNPNLSGGSFLDAQLAFIGMQREEETPTVVSGVTVTGVVGTTIPISSQARTGAGDIFVTLSAVTIPDGGTTTVNFASQSAGPVPCAIDALNVVVSNVLGWETVNNSAAGVLGTTTQSDQAARALRQNTLGFQGVALPVAITSALYATQGVTSLFFQENISDSTQTINDISMISHSIYVCVDGGSDTDVAAALLENKSSGCGWNGGTTVNVIEPASGQSYPVKFDRPTPIGILINVTTTNGNVQNITQSILNYAAGLINGLAGFVVGADVSPFEIAGAIMSDNPGYYISLVEISYESSVSFTTDVLAIAVNEKARTQSSFINVSVSP